MIPLALLFIITNTIAYSANKVPPLDLWCPRSPSFSLNSGSPFWCPNLPLISRLQRRVTTELCKMASAPLTNEMSSTFRKECPLNPPRARRVLGEHVLHSNSLAFPFVYLLLPQWCTTGDNFAPPPTPRSRSLGSAETFWLLQLGRKRMCYWHLVGRGQILLNILQHTGFLPTVKNYLTQNVNSADVNSPTTLRKFWHFGWDNSSLS